MAGPIVVAGSSLSHNYLELINNIRRECAQRAITTTVGATDTGVINLMWYLNATIEEVYSHCDWPFAEADATFVGADGQEEYALPSDYDKMESDPRDASRKFRFVERETIDAADPNLDSEGQPTCYSVWNGNIQLWPKPDDTYMEDKAVLGTDANYYACKAPHTATAPDRPITGAKWATYWELTTTITTAPAWVLGTDYKDGRIRLRYYRRPTPMANDGDYPDVPDKYLELVKIGARARYKEYLESADATTDYVLYREMRQTLARRKRQVDGPTKMKYMRK